MPTNRGFDQYLGLPYSQDMGITIWGGYNTPLPLFNGTTVIQQPVDLGMLEKLYVETAVDFIARSAASGQPFYLYYPFNHVHSPQSSGPDFCGKTNSTGGDAIEELDWAIGQVMASIKGAGPAVASNTVRVRVRRWRGGRGAEPVDTFSILG